MQEVQSALAVKHVPQMRQRGAKIALETTSTMYCYQPDGCVRLLVVAGCPDAWHVT